MKQKIKEIENKKELSNILIFSEPQIKDYYCHICFDDDYDRDDRFTLFCELVKSVGSNYKVVSNNKIKSLKTSFSLLHYAVIHNEISFVCYLIKNNVDICAKTNKNENVLHICVECKNYDLLKFFINKFPQININEQDTDGETPLLIAFHEKNNEMIKLIVNNGGDMYVENDMNITSSFVLYYYLLYDHKEETAMDLFECIAKKNVLLHSDLINLATMFIEKNMTDYLLTMINSIPNIINNIKLIHFSLLMNDGKENENTFLLLNSQKYVVKPCENSNSLFNFVLQYGNIKYLKPLFENNKNIILEEKYSFDNNYKNKDKLYSLYDYLFVNEYIYIDFARDIAPDSQILCSKIIAEKHNNCEIKKTNEQIIEVIKFLIDNGLDINEKLGNYYPVEYAVKYRDKDFIEEFIKLGCNIHISIVNKQAYPIFGNSDLLSLAVETDNIDLFEYLLVDKKIVVNNINITKEAEVPTCLLTAIFKDNYGNFVKVYDLLEKNKYIDKLNKNFNKILGYIASIESLDNYKMMGKYLVGEEYEEYKLKNFSCFPRIIKRFIPNFDKNISKDKDKILIQLLDFCRTTVSFLKCMNNYEIVSIIKRYNEFLDEVVPDYKLIQSFLNIISYICGFENDYVIKKYLDVLNNYTNEYEKKSDFQKYRCVNISINVMIMKFFAYIMSNKYRTKFMAIERFIGSIKQHLMLFTDFNMPKNKHCAKSCNNYSCGCENVFYKENTIISNEEFINIISSTIYKFDNIKDVTFYYDESDEDTFDSRADEVMYKYLHTCNVCGCCNKRDTNKKKKKNIQQHTKKNKPEMIFESKSDYDSDINEDECNNLFHDEKNRFSNLNKKNKKKSSDKENKEIKEKNKKQIKENKKIKEKNKKEAKEEIEKEIKEKVKEENKKEYKKEIKEIYSLINFNMSVYDIKKSLFKLYFPNKVEHYGNIYSELLLEPQILQSNDKIEFMYNNKKYTIYNINNKPFNKTPSRWIKYYSPNIGQEEKQDFDHDIPFWIDKILHSINCYEMEIDDINNKDLKSKMFYFLGEISSEAFIKKGIFEYFVNGTGTLFHRMFRQYHKIAPEIKQKINYANLCC